jgi:wobble nucleotide-excising tRNase
MPIKQIRHIKSVGKYRRYGAKGDVTFKKVTLVFGENARGKTTLCAILHSLNESDSALIAGRKTLGDNAAPEVLIELDEGRAHFSDGAWTKPEIQLRIFDDHYISRNVYTNNAIGTDQRRNLCRVLLGREGAALGERYDAVDAKITQRNRDLRELRNQLRLHSSGLPIDEFVLLPLDVQIDAKIEAKSKELEGARQIAQLSAQPALDEIALPRFPTLLNDLIKKSVDDVSAEAELKVREHIAKHRMESLGSRWIVEGLPHLIDNECPFCGLAVAGVDLIADYKSVFTNQFRTLREEIVTYRSTAERVFSDEKIELVLARFQNNSTRMELWRAFVEQSNLDGPPLEDISNVLREFRSELFSTIDKKLASLTEANDLSPEYQAASEIFKALFENFERYNSCVRENNVAIEAFKTEAKRRSAEDVQNQLNRLAATKRRHETQIAALCDQYVAINAEKTRLESEKVEVRGKIDQYSAQIMVDYAEEINALLRRFKAGFLIDRFKLEYAGRIPNSSFGVVINDFVVEMGSVSTPLDEPSFRNTLSGGDRSTLALAFFLAQLKKDSDRSKSVVVFDDPFSSHDQFRRTCTIGEIVRAANEVSQIVVLSHDRRFLKDIWDYPLPPAHRKALCIVPAGHKDSEIIEWDIAAANESEDAANRRSLTNYFIRYGGEPRDVVQKLRPVLETYLLRIAPEELVGAGGLGNMIERIRASQSLPLANVLTDLEDVNSYTRRYMHGEAPDADVAPISREELHGFVDRVLTIVGIVH